ncbi:MAG: hypothetical protein HC882_06800 [Acidobacteria bacterium]|nr:hypothetical protein [Acidobacteriota bacterium]
MTRMLMVLAVCVIAAAASPALAVGPVDVEVGVKYWVHEVEPDGDSETYDGDAPGFFAEVWINKLGFTAAWHQSRVDENGVESDVDFQGIDARWKLFSVTDNNFIGLGAGLQQLEFDSPDGSADSTGFRLVADGQAGLGKIVYVFGEAVYYIGMDDADLPGGGSLEDIEGWEFEFGVSVKPFPFLNAKAGYRTSQVDGTFEGNSSDTKFDGWFGAVSVNF